MHPKIPHISITQVYPRSYLFLISYYYLVVVIIWCLIG